MLAFGTPKRLSIPVTPEDTLRELLGEVLTPDREQALKAQGRTEGSYEAAGLGGFHVKLTARPGGFDVVFVRESRRPAPVAASTPTPAVPFAPAPAHVPAPLPLPGPAAAPPAAPAPAPTPDEAPTATLLRLLAAAFALRASDLHLTDGQPPLVRVDGSLRRLGDETIELAATVPQALAQGFSGDAAVDVPGSGRARLHVFRTSEGLAASVRLLPPAAPSLASLHLPVALEDLVEIPHGLVLVCGATGSGKSTTLAALAQEALRRRSIVLTTLEDPIEHALVASETSLVRRRQIRARRARLRVGSSRRAARGPRRSPARRDARSRDHRNGADRSRDGPPRPVVAPQRLGGIHGRAHRRRLPALAARPVSASSSPIRSAPWWCSGCCRAREARAASSRSRSCA